jgi:hypothetical protein
MKKVFLDKKVVIFTLKIKQILQLNFSLTLMHMCKPVSKMVLLRNFMLDSPAIVVEEFMFYSVGYVTAKDFSLKLDLTANL